MNTKVYKYEAVINESEIGKGGAYSRPGKVGRSFKARGFADCADIKSICSPCTVFEIGAKINTSDPTG